MGGLLPPVIATLIADTKQYTAKITEADGQMAKFGATADGICPKPTSQTFFRALWARSFAADFDGR